jgi:predicted aldo/keto reductase-like oxidoreductase
MASNCVYCLQCEDACPQNIQITQWLDAVEEVLVENKPYSDLKKPSTAR